MQEAVHGSGCPRPEKVKVPAQTHQEVLSLFLNHLFCISFLWLLKNGKNLLLLSPESQESKIKVPAGLVPSEAVREDVFHASLPASVGCWPFLYSMACRYITLISDCFHMASDPSVCVSNHSLLFLLRTPVIGLEFHPKSSMVSS